MAPALIAVLAFAGVGGAAYAVSRLSSAGRRLDDRISQVVEGAVPLDEEEIDQAAGRSKKREERLPALAKALAGRGILEKLEKRLVTAGLLLRPTEFLAIWAASAIGMLLISLLLGRGALLVTVLLTGLGLWVPHGILNFLYNRRRTSLEGQLADALTMIASGLKAGYTVLQGMQAASEQLPNPISAEFGRVAKLVNVGMDFGGALRRMGDRVGSYDFDIVITAVNIQLQTGGNLSGLLESIAATIRDRITLRREIKAATSQGVLSGAILVLLPVGIGCGLMVINRPYANYLFTTALGRNLLKLALVQQLLGIWLIKRLLNFDA
jgi:tight adherence protein B